MKIIGIVGSPRARSNTSVMVKEVLAGCRQAGAQTEIVFLRQKKIKICQGCLKHTINDAGNCPQKDEMLSIIKQLIQAEAVIFGSPTYNDSVASLMKVFMDRLMSCWSRKDNLKKKKAAAVSVGQANLKSVRLASGYIGHVCQMYGLPFLGSVEGIARNPEEIKKDKKILERCFRLGSKLVK